jgi:hypothetical protein
MLIRHPLLAMHHIIDGLRKQPIRPREDEQDSEHV